MFADMREMISESLTELITECTKVINDTTGRLQGEDEQMLNAAVPSTDASLQFDDLTEEQVTD